MTLAIADVSVFSPRRTAWVERDAVHDCRLRGAFAGCVLRNADGSFVAFDGRSTPIGRYRTLREAKRAVLEIARGVTETRSARLNRVAQSFASVTGVISVALLMAAGVEATLPLV